jgi:hypothetical protein
MTTQEIIISFSKDGTPSIEVKGVKGSSCLKLTEDLERALGAVENRQKKPEFRQETETGAHLRVGGKS